MFKIIIVFSITGYLDECDKIQENIENQCSFSTVPFIVIIMYRMTSDSMNVGIIICIFTFKYQFE